MAGGSCYSYSQFCDRYNHWRSLQKRSMRQNHRAGEKCFIDYCGQSVPIICADTGEIRSAQLFVAVLGTQVSEGDGLEADADSAKEMAPAQRLHAAR